MKTLALILVLMFVPMVAQAQTSAMAQAMAELGQPVLPYEYTEAGDTIKKSARSCLVFVAGCAPLSLAQPGDLVCEDPNQTTVIEGIFDKPIDFINDPKSENTISTYAFNTRNLAAITCGTGANELNTIQNKLRKGFNPLGPAVRP